MAELMSKSQQKFVTVRKGDLVEGVVSKLTSSEILVDIGAKTEAVVLEKDRNILRSLLSTIKEGDKVTVSVLNPESDQGNPVVSLRRFIDGKVWGDLEKLKEEKKILEVDVTEMTRGGFLVISKDGLSGFLPNSQTMLNVSSQNFVGKTVKVQIHEINRALHKVIFSQKAAMGDEDFSNYIGTLKTGQIVDCEVSNSASFGAFVSIKLEDQSLEGFIHLSELSWDKLESAESFFKPGEKIKAQVIGIDREAKRINLSVKRLTKDPFEETIKNYPVDKKVKGTVKQISSLGVLVDLGEGVEGLIKKEKVPPSLKLDAGQEIDATVSEQDIRRHRLILVPVLLDKPMGYR